MKNEYRIEGDTVIILCGSPEGTVECYIDTVDLPKMHENWTWRAHKGPKDSTPYVKSNGVLLHRHLMDAPKGSIVDHIDRNGLNNRTSSNLRLVTASESVQNRSVFKNSTTGHAGVSWSKQYGKWKAKIRVGGKEIYLGRFDTIEEAITTRKLAELKYWS